MVLKVFVTKMSLNKIFLLCLIALCTSNDDICKEDVNLSEGCNCTWNGLDGTCTNIINCQSAIDGLQQKIHPHICSFQGKTPIVCCTINEGKSTTTAVPDYEIDERFNQTGSKAKRYCLKYLQHLNYPCSFTPRGKRQTTTQPDSIGYDYMGPSPMEDIDRRNVLGNRFAYLPPDFGNIQAPPPAIAAGIDAKRNEYPHMDYNFQAPLPPIAAGIDARRNQYPHMALLGYGYDIETAQWLCGGSVISEKYILTAAHCISSPTVGSVKYVGLGILRRSDPLFLWQKHNVKKIIAHPEYQPPSKYNDIALLETEKEITFNYRVLPACLQLVPESDEVAEATGWGALGHHKELADTLQTVKLHRYDAEKCSQLYPKHRHLREGYNHSSQMCYGHTVEAKDTCEGDSGGPLQTRNAFLSCAHTVLGVTSYGRQCGISAGSGMYTRVYHYVPWIESVVWP